MKKHFLVSVGLSLKDNMFKDQNDLSKEEKKKHFMEMVTNNKEVLFKMLDYGTGRASCAEWDVLKRILNVEREYPTNSVKITFFYAREERKEDFNEGQAIANFLREFILWKFNGTVDVDIQQIKPFDPQNIWNKLWQVHKKHKDYSTEIIAAGGYKPMAGTFMLYGMLMGLRVYYKYENKDVVVINPLPVIFDVPRLFYFVAASKSSGESKVDKDVNFLDFEYLSDIKEFFMYKEPVLNLVNDEKKYELERAIKIWSNLWIGDLIPETVEHSKNHSRRILDRFELLYESLSKADIYLENFDWYEFLKFLIAAAYLHDIGHSVMSLNNGEYDIVLKDVPEAVRSAHHILSAYEVLKNKKFFKLDKIFSEEELVALSLIVLYHRKSMPLDENYKQLIKKNFDGHNLNRLKVEERNLHQFLIDEFLIKEIEKVLGKKLNISLEDMTSLEEILKEIYNNENKIRLLLGVCAMLKFLDELDVQADRIVDEYYKRVRFKRLKEEINELLRDIDDEKLTRVFRGIIDNDSVIESGFEDESFNELKSKVYTEMFQKLRSSKLIEDELSKKVKAIFKLDQFNHFKKHEKVLAVFPLYDKHSNMVDVVCYTNEEEFPEEAKRDIENQIKLLRSFFEEFFKLSLNEKIKVVPKKF